MRRAYRFVLLIVLASLARPESAWGQCSDGSPPPCSQPRPKATIRNVPNGLGRLTATYQNTPLRAIRMELGLLIGRTVIASAAADTVRITARIDDQQWDLAFRALLLAHKLDGEEDEQGILLIQTADEMIARDAALPLITRIVVLQRPAAGLAELARKRLTAAGRLDVDSLTNSMIITDRAAAVETIVAVLKELDRLAPASSRPPRRG